MALDDFKICPECGSEYYAYVMTCADCGTGLLAEEENRKVQDERQRCMEADLKDHVVIRQGDLRWMRELSTVIVDAGIPCRITTGEGCTKRCCGDTHQLMVSSHDAETAQEKVEAYYALIHPELQASQEMSRQGKCPACASPVSSDAVQCPDCGLLLLITE